MHNVCRQAQSWFRIFDKQKALLRQRPRHGRHDVPQRGPNAIHNPESDGLKLVDPVRLPSAVDVVCSRLSGYSRGEEDDVR